METTSASHAKTCRESMVIAAACELRYQIGIGRYPKQEIEKAHDHKHQPAVPTKSVHSEEHALSSQAAKLLTSGHWIDAMLSIVNVPLGPGQLTLRYRELPSSGLGTEKSALVTCTKTQLQCKWVPWDYR